MSIAVLVCVKGTLKTSCEIDKCVSIAVLSCVKGTLKTSCERDKCASIAVLSCVKGVSALVTAGPVQCKPSQLCGGTGENLTAVYDGEPGVELPRRTGALLVDWLVAARLSNMQSVPQAWNCLDNYTHCHFKEEAAGTSVHKSSLWSDRKAARRGGVCVMRLSILSLGPVRLIKWQRREPWLWGDRDSAGSQSHASDLETRIVVLPCHRPSVT